MSILRLSKKGSEIPVLPQPVCLGWKVPVNNIALVVLKTPGSDDKDVSFTDPDAFFDLALYPAHTGNTIITPHPYMICPHHEISKSKLLICPLFWQPYPDNRRTVFVYRIGVKFIIIIVISNSHNSVGIFNGV